MCVHYMEYQEMPSLGCLRDKKTAASRACALLKEASECAQYATDVRTRESLWEMQQCCLRIIRRYVDKTPHYYNAKIW